MAYFDRYLISGRLRGYIVGAFTALLALAVCLTAPVAEAQPTTFAYEAVVVDADIISPKLLPFSIQFGDIIPGTFDVRATTFHSADLENISLSLGIDDTILQLDGAFGRMYSDRIITGGPGEPPLGPVDIIALGCVGEEPGQPTLTCLAGEVSGASDLEWRPTLSFGIEDVLSEGDDLTIPATWNSFPARQLSITFATSSGSIVATVRAAVGNVVLVPESATTLYIAAFLASIVACPRQACCRTRSY